MHVSILFQYPVFACKPAVKYSVLNISCHFLRPYQHRLNFNVVKGRMVGRLIPRCGISLSEKVLMLTL